jgi:hypothetical protein
MKHTETSRFSTLFEFFFLCICEKIMYLCSRQKKNIMAQVSMTVRMALEEPVSTKGLEAFYALREEARRNGLQGMSLNDINAEIHR